MFTKTITIITGWGQDQDYLLDDALAALIEKRKAQQKELFRVGTAIRGMALNDAIKEIENMRAGITQQLNSQGAGDFTLEGGA